MAAILTAVALSFPQVSYADTVTLTLVSSSLTVTEGGTATASFTFANNSGQNIVVPNASWGQQPNSSVAGDSSDTWNLFSANTSSTIGNCLTGGSEMASGTTCDFTISIGTFNDLAETDGDFGVTPMYATMDWCFDTGQGPGGCPAFNTAESDFSLTVLDPNATPPLSTPEPSTMLLFGAGLSGLAGLLPKRRARK